MGTIGQRGQPAIAVLAGAGSASAATTLAAVQATVPADVPIFVAGPAPEGPRWTLLDAHSGHAGRAAAALADAASPHDLVLLRAGAILAGPWLALLAAAASDSLTGSVCALERRSGGPAGPLSVVADRPLHEVALRLTPRADAPRPRVAEPSGDVLVVPRRVLELLGGLDPDGETFDELLRSTGASVRRAGLVNVVADDVLVEPASAAPPPTPDGEPLVSRALARARRAATGLSATVDARVLSAVTSGTQVHTLELLDALAALGDVRIRAILPPDVHPEAADRLATSGIELLPYEDAVRSTARTTIVHRPQQVNTVDDLRLLLPLGDRLVVTQQDLIGYRNPAYHDDAELWERHRRTTRYALGLADRVLFLSRHALADALAEDLIDPGFADVVGLGVDAPPASVSERPSGLPAGQTPFLLCLGADLRHKNRLFAIALLRALTDAGWDGSLVLAGPPARRGGTVADEAAALEGDPSAAPRVIRLGEVTGAEKRWLIEHAASVVFPTVDEGFGLVPFEAAIAGTPCAYAPQGALAEVAPEDEALLVPWDATSSAARVLPVLTAGPARDAHLAALRAAAAEHGWATTARATVAAYERAVALPRRPIIFDTRDRAADAAELAELRAFRDVVGEDGANLVGPPHPLLGDADRRALLAVVTRPGLRGPLLASLRALYRLGHRG